MYQTTTILELNLLHQVHSLKHKKN